MNEVEAMTRVKTAELAALAEEKLAEHGVAPEQLQQAFTETKDELVKMTRRARKDLAKQARQVRSELKSALDQTPRRRRRWPWIVGLLIAGGATAYVVLSRRPKEIRLEDVQEESGDRVVIPEPSTDSSRTRSNGRVTS